MIPTIEDIVAAVAAGTMKQNEAIAHIQSHLELASIDLRELFAAAALPTLIKNVGQVGWQAEVSWNAFSLADAMLEARKK